MCNSVMVRFTRNIDTLLLCSKYCPYILLLIIYNTKSRYLAITYDFACNKLV